MIEQEYVVKHAKDLENENLKTFIQECGMITE